MAVRMFKIFRRSFTKYLLSYVLCLILPLLVFSLLYKTLFLSAYSNQLVEKTAENLDYTFGNIDIQMNNLRHIGSQIMASRQFSDVFFEENPPILAYFTLRGILSMYAITNEFIFDIWYFDRSRGYVYSPAHMVSLDSFLSYALDYPEFNDREFEKIISSTSDRLWVPETPIRIFNVKHPLITCITAYPNSVTHENSALILLLRQDVFERSLRSVIPSEQSTAAVIDDAGQIIYSLNPGMNQAMEKIIAGRGLQNGGTAVLKADNREYFAYVKKSPLNKLTYVSLVSWQELTGNIQKYTMTFFIMVLVIVLFGSVLIFFLMKYNYSPLRKLIQYSREQFSSKSDKNMNDMDIIVTVKTTASRQIERI
jgi:heme/copper-type cytochrome/quinol oxidase subunit 4